MVDAKNETNVQKRESHMFQTRCFKCKAALETEFARKHGLGDTCAFNVCRAFTADKLANGTKIISGDTLFNLLSAFALDTNCAEAKEVALGLINANSFAEVTWEIMLGFFTLARTHREHGNEAAVEVIFKALRELCPRMTAMSLGESGTEEAFLDYDAETETVVFSATTVRIGSAELAKIAGVKRFGTRQWSFPLRGALAVREIVIRRWALAIATPAFNEACVLCAALPAVPPLPSAFSGYLATEMMVVTYARKGADRRDLLTREEGDALGAWLIGTIGASWYRQAYQQTGLPTWLIPAERYQEVMDRLAVVFAPRPVVHHQVSAPRRAYR